MPASYECAACNGLGGECPECAGRGEIEVTRCPLENLDEEVWILLHCAELYRKGLPPVAGGSLDQAAVFVEAARFIWAEKSHHKADAMKAAWKG